MDRRDLYTFFRASGFNASYSARLTHLIEEDTPSDRSIPAGIARTLWMAHDKAVNLAVMRVNAEWARANGLTPGQGDLYRHNPSAG